MPPSPGRRPFVHAFSTVTLDARLASKTGFSKLSCPHDLRRLHQLRAKYGAVMVGANTVLVDNPRLNLKYAMGENPVRIVIDGALRTSPQHRVYDNSAPTILVTSSEGVAGDPRKAEELEARGVKLVVLEPVEGTRVPLAKALEELAALGIKGVLVEGGGRLLWGLLRERLIDRLSITYVGTVYGSGTSLFEGEGFAGPEAPLMKPARVLLCPCGREIHVELEPVYGKSYLDG